MLKNANTTIRISTLVQPVLRDVLPDPCRRHTASNCVCISGTKPATLDVINRRIIGYFPRVSCLLDQLENRAQTYNAFESNPMREDERK